MAGNLRFVDDLLTNVSLRTAFSADGETERMGRLRPYITQVRRRWETNGGYRGLVQQVKALCDKDDLVPSVRAALERLFEGYRDYADIDLGRPVQPPCRSSASLDAIELYCSEEGYKCITKFIQFVFRTTQPSVDELIRATTFVEWITIDLYNLRLSQIGDPRFENFQGVVYRWSTLRREDLDEYRTILRLGDHAKRNYSIPLGLVSTTADSDATRHFGDTHPKDSEQRVRVRQTVHIHGMDPAVLASFRQRYPDSVVTSICAMPVAHMSSFGEQEILLRGPFFHLVAICDDREDENGAYVEFVTVSMNSNRDHGTEHSSNEHEKARQRAAFLTAVNVSKWEVCAGVAEGYSADDAKVYRDLQTRSLARLTDEFGMSSTKVDGRLAEARSLEVATWLGDLRMSSYPSHYVQRRRAWQKALFAGDWVEAEKVVRNEYAWRRSEWYNVGNLAVRQAPEAGLKTVTGDDNNYKAWERLIREAISNSKTWKSLRSFDTRSITPADLAQENGLWDLAELLQPKRRHELDPSILSNIETQLQQLMEETIKPMIADSPFVYPQVSILQEMEDPVLWVPVPGMYGGFLIELRDGTLEVTVYETVVGQVVPRKTMHKLGSKPRLVRSQHQNVSGELRGLPHCDESTSLEPYH
ncbi:hypothetical protein QBC37DRAFT_460694 [Rhypophila decipiens]|uniref:Uncharacterized protein n=1 Tax=Rhypophila decipiens TaxID=261697 RepID=A0AAN6XT08_9PEZI|nr:hypothetical protein QBC37DRAFT_460694 [Rhypophila decipiens]